MSQKYRISYKHQDMPPDYTGMKTIWASDEKKAMRLLTGRVTKVGQWTPAKSGAVLKVISVEDATHGQRDGAEEGL
tara:strand:- start:93 stop:320 length:228 start_codon:yes stop_codon:yes gene_type:complete